MKWKVGLTKISFFFDIKKEMTEAENMSKMVHSLVIMHNGFSVYRWQTDRYHKRQAVEQLIYELDVFMDTLVISYQGRTNHRIFFSGETVHLRNMDDKEIEFMILDMIALLTSFYACTDDVDYYRISFISKLYQTLYEFTVQ